MIKRTLDINKSVLDMIERSNQKRKVKVQLITFKKGIFKYD